MRDAVIQSGLRFNHFVKAEPEPRKEHQTKDSGALTRGDLIAHPAPACPAAQIIAQTTDITDLVTGPLHTAYRNRLPARVLERISAWPAAQYDSGTPGVAPFRARRAAAKS